MQIRAPGYDELARRWREIEPILARATRYNGGRAEPIDLLQLTLRGELGMWLIEDDRLLGVVTARAAQYPRKRELFIDHIAGVKLGEWWPLFVGEMDKVAKTLNCSAIFAFGRPGWKRFWESRGIATHVASEVFVREVN